MFGDASTVTILKAKTALLSSSLAPSTWFSRMDIKDFILKELSRWREASAAKPGIIQAPVPTVKRSKPSAERSCLRQKDCNESLVLKSA